MKKKDKSGAVLLLWFLFLIMVAGIAYMSFQNGETAKQVSEKVILKLAGWLWPERSLAQEELLTMTYGARQAGRVLGFLAIGFLGTVTIHLTLRRSNWLFRTILAAGLLFAVAYFTESLKKYIPTRHYSYEELLLSMVAVTAGFLVVSVVSLFFEIIKWIGRIVAAC